MNSATIIAKRVELLITRAQKHRGMSVIVGCTGAMIVTSWALDDRQMLSRMAEDIGGILAIITPKHQLPRDRDELSA